MLYGDTDQMGFVYYANYLRYFEAGRGEFMRARGRSYRSVEEGGIKIPVVEARVRYRAPALYDDVLRIETTLSEVTGATFQFRYELRRKADERLIAEGETLHACLGPAGRPVRVPTELAELVLD